jgi:glycosyltransferase involved in cell wall biosynthesis
MGLGKWVSGQNTILLGHLDGYFRKCIRKLLCGAEQAWILKEDFREEVQIFQPKRVELLINGIPDLFPDYSEALGSQRKARADQLRLLNEKSNHIGPVRFLHLGLCSREKGIFLELEFLQRWAEAFPENPPKLRMCGVFDSQETEMQFRAATAGLDVECVGAVDGAEKKHALQNTDVLLFFSQLPETMGLVVVEAMSAGLLPFVAKGKNIESILEGADLCAINPLNSLEGVRRALKEYNPDRLRTLFVEHYTLSVFALRVRKALSELQL